ncbi:MAG: amidohydrolase family protein, partial [Deinococcota bacterium]
QGMVHLVTVGLHNLKRQLAAGVTTVRDLGSPHKLAIDLAKAVATGKIYGPKVLPCGGNITMTGGHGHMFGHEADGVDGIRHAAREELKQGAQVLKFMATGGVITRGVAAGAEAYSEAELRAGVEEAHKKGKHTAAHAQGLKGILNALRAGIDTIEHGAFDHWNDDALELLKTRVLVPTLAAPEGIAAGSKHIADWIVAKTLPIVDVHRRNSYDAWQAGVPIVAGSDAGTPMNPHGRLIRELQLLHEMGLSLAEVLQAATSTAAKALRLESEIGSLNPGTRADLSVWARNPLEDIRAYNKPEAVFLAGEKAGLELLPAV